MAVLIERLDRETNELEPLARVADGEILSGADALAPYLYDGVPTEDELVERFDGPTIYATPAKSDT